MSHSRRLPHMNQLQGIYYAAISGLCFGLLGYFGVTVVNSGMSITTMLFWRFFLAMLITLPTLLLKPKLLKQNAGRSWRIILYDSVFYALSALTYFQASYYIGTGLAMVIFFTYPVIVMLLNWLFYQTRMQRIYYLAFPILFLGLFCLSGISEAHMNGHGILLSLISAFFYACYIFSSKAEQSPSEVSTVFVTIGCSIIYLTISIWQGHFTIPTTIPVWSNLLGLSIICTALPIYFFLKSLKFISAVQASMISVLEPIFVALFGVWLLHESISGLQIIGVVLTLSSASMTLIASSNQTDVAC